MLTTKTMVISLCLLLSCSFLPAKVTKKDKAKNKSSFLVGNTMFHCHHIDLFKSDPVCTEYTAYKLLKKQAVERETHYFVAPWAPLINQKKLKDFADFLQKKKIKLNGGFTICQHIRYKLLLPILKMIGITELFTTHAEKNETYNGVTILPFPHYPVNGIKPAEHKDIYYSFIGYNSHPVREVLFTMPTLAGCIIKERKDWHFYYNDAEQAQQKTEYQDVLARSRYSLCPRGTGPSTLRFWESLQAGAIPVLLADDMALPQDFDWDSCMVRIPESDVLSINTILASISAEQEEQMRQRCLEAFALFSGENFVSTIRNYYRKK